MQNMYINQSNFSKAEMEIYYELVNKFYPNRKEDGYFRDLGANIGTTCIYFKKYLDSKVKILAFEPITETFKFLKINLILNDIEDYVIEKLALSDKTEERDMYLRPGNPGGVGFLYNWGAGKETVGTVSLDDYFTKHNLNPQDIKYMWVDTEGFEVHLLKGALSILQSGDIPLYMEFNSFEYKVIGMYEQFMDLITKIYTKVIYIPEAIKGNKIIHPISDLWKFKELERAPQIDIFFIK